MIEWEHQNKEVASMEYYIDPKFCERILGYARSIATTRGHAVNEHGLQLDIVLSSKRFAEIQELREAILQGKDRVDLLSEAADVAYYSIQLDVVASLPSDPHIWYIGALETAQKYGLDQEEIEAALEAKYSLRASLPYRKDKETAHQRQDRQNRENEAILTALAQILWTGLSPADIASDYGVPLQTIYSAVRDGKLTHRQSGGKSSIIIRKDAAFRAWLACWRSKAE
jgi:hypothetical protein